MTQRFAEILAAAAIAIASLQAAPALAGPSILVDIKTGAVLAQKDAFRRWYPASLTKLMTAYVAFRAVEAGEVTLESPVYVSKNAAKEPPSKMGYAPGTVLTLDTALKIIMVKSANDVATAIGESLAGSEANFASRMNAEARRLGMTGTNFVNAHGLHSDEQYTTARDLAVLALAIRREFPRYDSYFAIEGLAAGKAAITNHNTLIGRFDGADGMKTGYTCPAGFNLVATATRGERRMLAVVIGSTSIETRAAEAADLLAAGFSTQGAGPSLATLSPIGEGLDEATNMRPMLCTKEAREALAKSVQRDDKGRPLIQSAHVHDPVREPVLTAISVGGATGPASPALKAMLEAAVEYADVPIPTPRPDYTPVTAAKAGASQMQ